jgi:hypothetical protein
MKRKNIINILAIASIISMVPMIATANEVITGKFVGLISLNHHQDVLKINGDKEIKTQADLIVFEVNNRYYKIVNMPINEKGKYINKSVKIIGDIYDEHDKIEAEEVKIKMRTRYVKVWSDEKLKAMNKWKKWEKKQRETGWTPEGAGG